MRSNVNIESGHEENSRAEVFNQGGRYRVTCLSDLHWVLFAYTLASSICIERF
jgi:hypothetical protein